jgi:hypothetical protein
MLAQILHSVENVLGAVELDLNSELHTTRIPNVKKFLKEFFLFYLNVFLAALQAKI